MIFLFTLSETSAEKQNPSSPYIVDKIVVSMTTIKQDFSLKKTKKQSQCSMKHSIQLFMF